MIKEHPILYCGDMVRAMLESRKTQTRRPIKGQWFYDGETGVGAGWEPPKCPYGQAGDRLWIRETWQEVPIESIEASRFRKPSINDLYAVIYRADGEADCKWRSSRHMPRSACRLTPDIANIFIERVCDITEETAKAEGFHSKADFLQHWDQINGSGSWKSNPCIWVVETKVV